MNVQKLLTTSILALALFGCEDSSSPAAPAPAEPKPVSWTLDISMGRQSLTALTKQAIMTGSTFGSITGKINGFDSTKFVDSIQVFCNVGGKEVLYPLSATGAFSFSASDFPIRETGTYFIIEPIAKPGFEPDPMFIRVGIEVM